MLAVTDADLLAVRAHGADRNKAGLLFIDHVRRVAAAMRDDPDPIAVPAALLHDSVEKGSFSWDDLHAAGADDRLIAVVDALTERDGEAETEYFTRCVADPLALRIKRADIQDKFDVIDHSDLPAARRAELHRRATQRMQLLEQVASA